MDDNRPRKILFCSYHCFFDPSSGATISLQDLFRLLRPRGWECQAFCGPLLDYEEPKQIPDLLREMGLRYQERAGNAHGTEFRLYNANIDGVPTAIYETPAHPPARKLTELQGRIHLTLQQQALAQFQPDIVITYGGQIMATAAMAQARNAGAAVVFWLRNMAYNHRPFFRHADGILVPSSFSAQQYQQAIGLACTAISSPLDWRRVDCGQIHRQTLTFINPIPTKGVYLFAGIARELAARRPDIPILVVEGRGNAGWLAKVGLDISQMPSLRIMPNTRDPKQFLGTTKVLLVPSLWAETFGRVAAEAMMNGIPVLGSNRGGLPDVLGRAGFVIPVPAAFTPRTDTVPAAEQLRPWLDTIIRLWDDPSFYVNACLRARVEAEKWKPETLIPQYETYFHNLLRTRSTNRSPGT